MKKDWEIKKLGELGNIFSGNSINEKEKKSYMDLSKKGLFYVATKDISSDSEIEYKNGILIPDECLSKFKIAHKDSVLICAEGGSAGKKLAYNYEYDICFVNKLFAFEANNSIFSKFVFYYYQSSDFVKHFKNRLAGLIGGVSLQKFKEIPCPVPPLEEQKRIVKILDEKFAQLETIKANVQTNLQNAKDLFQSQLTKAFSNTTWEKKKLGDVSTVTSSKRIYAEEQTESGIPFLRVSDLVSRINGIETNDLYISEEKYFDFVSKGLVPKENDLLITSRGTLGLCYIVKEDDKFYFQDGMITWISLQPCLQSKFVSYLFDSPLIKNQINEKAAGAAVSYISISDIRLFEIPLPPLPEQKRIVEELDTLSEKVRQLQEIYTKQIANCDELKQSLLQKAFEGEL